MKIYLLTIFLVLFTGCTYTSEYTYNSVSYETYEDYISKCETLLDSIATWDDSFLETDVYQEYLEAREKLDEIWQ